MLKIIVPLAALLLGSWFVYDGARALTKGDYTTPSSGPHAGQLGPWSKIVASVGLDPHGQAMKIAHVSLGVLWIAAAALFVLNPAVGRLALIVCSCGTLWYAPLGTVISLGLLVALVWFIKIPST
ncbi:MAG: hypothetical protein QM790_16065 [Nibricoccus sp.]